MSSIKVSVAILTYNQENSIREAIESVLSQQVNFNVEVIVVNDGSTDNSDAVIKELAVLSPQIVYVHHKENLGIRSSVIEVSKILKGEYVAVLDGDDLWCYPHKLQTQIDFLDNNAEYEGCFHDTAIQNMVKNGNSYFAAHKYYSQRYSYENDFFFPDIVDRISIISSSSSVMRARRLKKLNMSILDDNLSIDWKLKVLIILDDKFKYFNEVWSVYRNHDGGISKSNKVKFHLSHIRFLRQLLEKEWFENRQYDIYRAISSEYRVLLTIKESNETIDKQKLFPQYLKSEFARLWYFRKQFLGSNTKQ
ncbi:MAG: hypothetical protein BGO32_03650 [Bacteroidetes bacterium 37-13]|nr:MAG: hypothetical protein BGO32_03650 [Bacteroidetes bacterium 37-13]